MELKRLKNLREDNDLYQKEIADILKIKQQQYSRYETGYRDIPLEMLKKLAIFYETSTDYILCLTDIKTPYKRKKGL